MIAAQHSSWVLPAALAVRTLAIAIVVILGLRLFGKREMGQLNIADLAAIMVQGRISKVGKPHELEAELQAAYLGGESVEAKSH